MGLEKWTEAPLKNILDGTIRNGYSPVAADKETGYWVLGLGALGEDKIQISEIKPVTPEQKVLQNILKINDFLVSRSNTPSKVGRSIRFKGEIENCSYPDLMMRFRINESEANIAYVEKVLHSLAVRSYFSRSAAGSSGTMVKINKGVLEKTPIPLPPLPEQRKIAKILQTWDRAIASTEKLIDASKQQKKALMQQLLTGKKRFAGFEGEWRKVRLESIGKCMTGLTYSPDDVCTDGLLVLRSSNIQNGVICYDDNVFVSKSVVTNKLTKAGDILICVRNGSRKLIGKSAYIEENSAGHAHGAFMSLFRGEFPQLIFQLLQTHNYHRQVSMNLGATINSINNSALNKFSFKIPSNEEEIRKISDLLSCGDEEIKKLYSKLALLKKEKKALMQQLLTGKRRVKVDE